MVPASPISGIMCDHYPCATNYNQAVSVCASERLRNTHRERGVLWVCVCVCVCNVCVSGEWRKMCVCVQTDDALDHRVHPVIYN